MKKKHLIVIGVCVVGILSASLLNARIFNTEKEITQEAALREIPFIIISPEEISLMNSLWNDTDIQQAMLDAENDKENIFNFSADDINGIETELFPDSSNITVDSGLVSIAYRYDEYTVLLRIDPDESIHKTVLLFRTGNSVKASWANHNNEVYSKYQFGLF